MESALDYVPERPSQGGELIICYWMELPGLSPSDVTVGVEIALKYVQLILLTALHYMHIIVNIAL